MTASSTGEPARRIITADEWGERVVRAGADVLGPEFRWTYLRAVILGTEERAEALWQLAPLIRWKPEVNRSRHLQLRKGLAWLSDRVQDPRLHLAGIGLLLALPEIDQDEPGPRRYLRELRRVTWREARAHALTLPILATDEDRPGRLKHRAELPAQEDLEALFATPSRESEIEARDALEKIRDGLSGALAEFLEARLTDPDADLREIADVLGISHATARKRWERIRDVTLRES